MDDEKPTPRAPVPEFLAPDDEAESRREENPFRGEEVFIVKGDFFDLKEKVPSLHEINVGVGWDRKIFEEKPLDVDLSCFLINKIEQTRSDEDFIFYNNEKACGGAVRHRGDSRTGAGDGDDETVIVDLNGLPFDVLKAVFTITIYNAAEREQNFGLVRNLYFRISNAQDDEEIFRYLLSEEEFNGEIGIKIGELIREGPKWYFSALGQPIPGGLGAIATQYGCIITL